MTFDPQELEYQGFTSKLGDAFTLTVDDSDKATGRLTVWMMSNEGTNLPADENSSAALMDLQFKAIGETDSADLTFTFADESVAGYVDGDPQFIDSGAYTATSVFESVAIRVYRPYLTMRLVDESGNAVTEITQGQTVKAIVSLKQYYPDESWAMMSLDLQFNGNKFKYDLNSLISKENLVDSVTGEAVTMLPAETEDPAKPLSICFFSSELNDMVLNGGATEADILELTLEATGAGNALEIGASFLQEGNIKYNTEINVDLCANTPEEISEMINVKNDLKLDGGILITNPIPMEYEIPHEQIDDVIKQAIDEMNANNIIGKESTPFLLAKICELTGGNSLESNIKLVYNNCELAAKIAKGLN